MKTRTIIIIHSFFWLCQHATVYIFYIHDRVRDEGYIPLGFPLDYLFFYMMYLWIYPRVYKGKPWPTTLVYFILTTIFYLGGTYIAWNYAAILNTEGATLNLPQLDLPQIDTIITVWIGNLISSAAFRSMSYWWNSEKRKKSLELETLTTELLFLKSQMNPHFLFNTINNIFALSLQDSPNTTRALQQLKTLMNYILEFEKKTKITIDQEINFLKSFIDLNRLRHVHFVDIEFQYTNESSQILTLEPMLLIAFIENAFKHGDTFTVNAYILINIYINDDQLILKVKNNKIEKRKDKTGGIGIQNVQKRLNLLFPNGRHELIIDDEDPEQFQVTLKLFWK